VELGCKRRRNFQRNEKTQIFSSKLSEFFDGHVLIIEFVKGTVASISVRFRRSSRDTNIIQHLSSQLQRGEHPLVWHNVGHFDPLLRVIRHAPDQSLVGVLGRFMILLNRTTMGGRTMTVAEVKDIATRLDEVRPKEMEDVVDVCG